MKTTAHQPVAIACLFAWIGFVSAISFMESWLKFQAPGITLPIGLSIGRLVFGTLNKIEWVFAVVVAISAFANRKSLMNFSNIFLLAVIVILFLQTVWLLPALDERAELYIQGKAVSPSRLHIWFIAGEVMKVIALFIKAISLFKQTPDNVNYRYTQQV